MNSVDTLMLNIHPEHVGKLLADAVKQHLLHPLLGKKVAHCPEAFETDIGGDIRPVGTIQGVLPLNVDAKLFHTMSSQEVAASWDQYAPKGQKCGAVCGCLSGTFKSPVWL
ncbi:hypothetical protein CSB45_14810 [candidate division KSB3 bacterium]|uniref:Uncharacterized protein n=1 Tax=candidate division KSB3 bacterium TaxID=2044937 RepID=A0A2G6E1S4_9BACT|nr:MAG: hypothetical protein CSB45_14810 [candidate division KSB3 bacterium]PIE31095.1 MAG: hypothetical protein CSA57_00330 [candidate division KSB3 bacterium]